MERLRTYTAWLDGHRDLGYTLIRIYLGVALFIRGLVFITDSSAVMDLAQRAGVDWGLPAMLIHYVALAHLCGGLMLAGGLLTRIAALIQIPVLLGAVFFVHIEDGLMAAGQSLELASLVLFLLVVFLLFGSGPYSIDAYVEREDVDDASPAAVLP